MKQQLEQAAKVMVNLQELRIRLIPGSQEQMLCENAIAELKELNESFKGYSVDGVSFEDEITQQKLYNDIPNLIVHNFRPNPASPFGGKKLTDIFPDGLSLAGEVIMKTFRNNTVIEGNKEEDYGLTTPLRLDDILLDR